MDQTQLSRKHARELAFQFLFSQSPLKQDLPKEAPKGENASENEAEVYSKGAFLTSKKARGLGLAKNSEAPKTPEAIQDQAFSDFVSFCENFSPSCFKELRVEAHEEMRNYAIEIVKGVLTGQTHLDQEISKVSKNWRIERMPRVDLALLRLATFEIFYRPEIPKSVTINEAVELAKRFGTEGSASFVNGILDQFQKVE